MLITAGPPSGVQGGVGSVLNSSSTASITLKRGVVSRGGRVVVVAADSLWSDGAIDARRGAYLGSGGSLVVNGAVTVEVRGCGGCLGARGDAAATAAAVVVVIVVVVIVVVVVVVVVIVVVVIVVVVVVLLLLLLLHRASSCPPHPVPPSVVRPPPDGDRFAVGVAVLGSSPLFVASLTHALAHAAQDGELAVDCVGGCLLGGDVSVINGSLSVDADDGSVSVEGSARAMGRVVLRCRKRPDILTSQDRLLQQLLGNATAADDAPASLSVVGGVSSSEDEVLLSCDSSDGGASSPCSVSVGRAASAYSNVTVTVDCGGDASLSLPRVSSSTGGVSARVSGGDGDVDVLIGRVACDGDAAVVVEAGQAASVSVDAVLSRRGGASLEVSAAGDADVAATDVASYTEVTLDKIFASCAAQEAGGTYDDDADGFIGWTSSYFCLRSLYFDDDQASALCVTGRRIACMRACVRACVRSRWCGSPCFCCADAPLSPWQLLLPS